MLLMMKVVERVQVAKSFAKIAAGILTVSAAQASQQLRAVADAKMAKTVDGESGLKTKYDRVRKIARAAAEAAVHVATHRPEQAAEEQRLEETEETEETEECDAVDQTDDAPETQDAPLTQDAPATQDAQH